MTVTEGFQWNIYHNLGLVLVDKNKVFKKLENRYRQNNRRTKTDKKGTNVIENKTHLSVFEVCKICIIEGGQSFPNFS